MRVEQDLPPRHRDPLVVGVVIGVAVLAVALVGWLLIGIVTDSAPERMTVELENPTRLTLVVEGVDADGSVTVLGRISPEETTTRAEVPVPASDWTLVARYGDQEVWRSDPVPPDELTGGTFSAEIERTPEIEQLEREGFQ